MAFHQGDDEIRRLRLPGFDSAGRTGIGHHQRFPRCGRRDFPHISAVRVAFNDGVAIVPQSLSRAVSLAGVVFRALPPPGIPSEIVMLSRQWERTPAIVNFIHFAESFRLDTNSPLHSENV